MASTMDPVLKFARTASTVSMTHRRCTNATTVNAADMAGQGAGSLRRTPRGRVRAASRREKVRQMAVASHRRKLVVVRAVSSRTNGRNYHGIDGESRNLSHRRSSALQSCRRGLQGGRMMLATNGLWIRLPTESRLLRTSRKVSQSLLLHWFSRQSVHYHRHQCRRQQ